MPVDKSSISNVGSRRADSLIARAEANELELMTKKIQQMEANLDTEAKRYNELLM